MFVEIIPLQYEAWHNLMSQTSYLGDVSGMRQLLHSRNEILGGYDSDGSNLELISSMANSGGHAAYCCAQLFALEAHLRDKYGLGADEDYENLPRLVTGFWRMYVLEFRVKPPTCFQEIPKIGLTLALDFGFKAKSESVVRSLLKTYESEGETCVIPVTEENWKSKMCEEVETRFGVFLKAYRADHKFLFEDKEPAGADFGSGDRGIPDEDVPF